MNINKLIKEAHENAVEKGFYDCSECGGSGNVFQKNPDCKNCKGCDEYVFGNLEDLEECTIASVCHSCNGTGIDQNKNIPELLMLVITEIGEAVEALREKRFSDWNKYYISLDDNSEEFSFKYHIKDTFEDEIADVFIRLFDLCGYKNLEYLSNIKTMQTNNNLFKELTEISKDILNFEDDLLHGWKHEHFTHIINKLSFFCNHNNIDIEKHITAKMQYNKTRPKKHNKEF